jgi:general stress protein 26
MTDEMAGDMTRDLIQRTADTRTRLENDVDVWVSTASADGVPHLRPLSFAWDGTTLLIATPEGSPTGRNLASSGHATMALGHTRDVVMIDGSVEVIPIGELPQEIGDSFAARTEFEPRTLKTKYAFYRITPVEIQAWREVDELTDRTIMRGGAWLAD